jgi:hypothetical protein
MNDDEDLYEAIDIVREARLALLQNSDAVDELREHIGKVDNAGTRAVLTQMLDDDLKVLRERKEKYDPTAWRRLRCPSCNARPANELQAAQKFCHMCNVYFQ